MSDKNFKKGDRVRYIPSHAKGDGSHKDCQEGVVKRVTDEWVFVIYDNLMCIMVTGEEKYTAAATDPRDLILLHPLTQEYKEINIERPE